MTADDFAKLATVENDDDDEPVDHGDQGDDHEPEGTPPGDGDDEPGADDPIEVPI